LEKGQDLGMGRVKINSVNPSAARRRGVQVGAAAVVRVRGEIHVQFSFLHLGQLRSLYYFFIWHDFQTFTYFPSYVPSSVLCF
jgi:hypothetical protein